MLQCVMARCIRLTGWNKMGWKRVDLLAMPVIVSRANIRQTDDRRRLSYCSYCSMGYLRVGLGLGHGGVEGGNIGV